MRSTSQPSFDEPTRPKTPAAHRIVRLARAAVWRFGLVLLVATLVAAVGLAMPDGAAAAADAADGPLDIRAVDEYLEAQVDVGLPGLAVAITQGDRALHVQGYGRDSNGAKITEDTRFRMASVSKSFTALAVMQLVEKGQVRLDDPVVTHLPEFTPDDPRGDEITVRQLLSQTSGLADRAFAEISLPQPASLTQAVTRLDAAHLVADPGTQWNYHNPNYHVLARLVEVVSGLSFEKYLTQHVFSPLGMASSTTTETDDQEVRDLEDGYIFAYGQPISMPAPGFFVGGSGGVVSTASDLSKWLLMQDNGQAADGTRLLSTEGVETMHTPAEPGGYALGWDTDGPTEEPTSISHGGTEYTFSAHQTLLPESGFGIAVLFNSTTALGLEQTAIIAGLTDIVEGDAPPSGPAISSRTVDWILAALTLVLLALGIRGVLRARRWAARRARLPAWRVALRLLPHTALITLFATFPDMAGFLFGGRDVTWLSAVFGWFALVAMVTTAALASVGTIAARAVHLLRSRSTGRGVLARGSV